eukprot:CAMPEP_0206405804 /NCGR_PEP_ID=MMETSP0294-20121207/29330_1 /ASSEMBLY_ACC=CAM_ASM_000327 /TAXON_ID=39354 /ORGANISM="Heterosigma akashiwo, Strain CCMP2393" /LENGTH=162 /DNA_ID=CAMNT_0053864259 /DNA_START=599 /DNA_END=1084 /DNA_ORIENTATION=+
MRGKPVKSGLTVRAICDARTKVMVGWDLCDSEARSREELDEVSMDVKARVLLNFARKLKRKGHTLYADNWFPTLKSVKQLHAAGNNFCGILSKKRRCDIPEEMWYSAKEVKHMPPGQAEARIVDGVLMMTLKDNKFIHAISTAHSAVWNETEKKRRRVIKKK